MSETLEAIREELNAKHDASTVRITVERLQTQCNELRASIEEQETAADQAFNNADAEAYEAAVTRKKELVSELATAMEMLEQQSKIPELSQADYESYCQRINAAADAEDKKQGKRLVSLANQMLECLDENETLSNDKETTYELLYKYMKSRPEIPGRTYLYQYLRTPAERLQYKIADWVSE